MYLSFNSSLILQLITLYVNSKGIPIHSSINGLVAKSFVLRFPHLAGKLRAELAVDKARILRRDYTVGGLVENKSRMLVNVEITKIY